ncbi:MAG: zinc ribbon domain-containing protein [Candidatus Bathyarchaeota archaeon]
MSASYTSRDRCIQALNEGYSKALGSIVSEPLTHDLRRISEFKGGGFYGLTHVIQSRVGLTLYAFTAIMEFTADGQAGAVLHEPMKCYLGAMVPATAPGSIYVKEIRGFLSKSMTWIPYHKQLKASEVHEKKMDRSSLVDALNNDKELPGLVKKMPDARTIAGIDSNLNVSRWNRFEVKVNDEEENHNTKCQVVPMGDRTLVATQHVVDNPSDIVYSADVVLRVAETLRKNPHPEPTEGPIIQEWADQILKLITSSDTQAPPPRPPTPPTPQVKLQATAPQAAAGNTCSVCGHVSPPEYHYCGKCGAKLEPPPRQCPICGYKNTPDNNFCGKCGQPLTGGQRAPQPAPPASSDPMERIMSSVQNGRRARWLVQFGKGDQVLQEIHVWNLWEERWVSPQATFDRLLGAIQSNSHYEWVKALRYVYAPTGQTTSGGYMHLTIKFTPYAPSPFSGKKLQILAVGQGRMGGFRAVGADEQTLTREQYDSVFELAITRSEVVEELTLWVPSNL